MIVKSTMPSAELVKKLSILVSELGTESSTAMLLQNAKLPSRNTDLMLLRLLWLLQQLQLELSKTYAFGKEEGKKTATILMMVSNSKTYAMEVTATRCTLSEIAG